jgi:hypothetical protein
MLHLEIIFAQLLGHLSETAFCISSSPIRQIWFCRLEDCDHVTSVSLDTGAVCGNKYSRRIKSMLVLYQLPDLLE